MDNTVLSYGRFEAQVNKIKLGSCPALGIFLYPFQIYECQLTAVLFESLCPPAFPIMMWKT